MKEGGAMKDHLRVEELEENKEELKEVAEDVFPVIVLASIIAILLCIFMLRQYIRWGVPCPSKNHMDGKTVIVTDCTMSTRPSPSSPVNTLKEKAVKSWLEAIRQWYPHRHSRSYFLPPLHFNRVPYRLEIIEDQAVFVPLPDCNTPGQRIPISQRQSTSGQTVAGSAWSLPDASSDTIVHVQESDIKDDAANFRFLHCLRVLSEEESEVMMVISQLDFRRYLDGVNGAVNAVACSLLVKPSSLHKHQQRGDFDVLIVHKRCGLLVFEVKAVGENCKTEKELKEAVIKRVSKALKQLHKAEDVLKALVADLERSPGTIPGITIPVTTVLVLPNLTSHQLREALKSDTQVAQDLCASMHSRNLSEAIRKCLCKDQIPKNQKQPTSSSLLSWLAGLLGAGSYQENPQRKSPRKWWRLTLNRAGRESALPDDLYEQLLARFCGPATTVDVPTVTVARKVIRSRGQAAALTGLMMSSLALYPDQVDLLRDHRDLHRPKMFLDGPPGSGKTVVLVLKGIQWRNKERRVDVISICPEGVAVSIVIQKQITEALELTPNVGEVLRHQFDFNNPEDVTAAVEKLTQERDKNDQSLFLIIDEVGRNLLARFTEFCMALESRVPSLFVWAAGLERPRSVPRGMDKVSLHHSLRCPPRVEREVRHSLYIGQSPDHTIATYDVREVPVATEGPDVICCHHAGQPGHVRDDVTQCPQCARDVVHILNELEVNSSQPDSLRFKDVMILCEDPSESLPMVEELRHLGVPVGVVAAKSDARAVRDMSLALTDQVTVTDYTSASGLERRVVIGMGHTVRSWMRKTIRHEKSWTLSASVATLALLACALFSESPLCYLIAVCVGAIIGLMKGIIVCVLVSCMGGVLGVVVGGVMCVVMLMIEGAYVIGKTEDILLSLLGSAGGGALVGAVLGVVGKKLSNTLRDVVGGAIGGLSIIVALTAAGAVSCMSGGLIASSVDGPLGLVLSSMTGAMLGIVVLLGVLAILMGGLLKMLISGGWKSGAVLGMMMGMLIGTPVAAVAGWLGIMKGALLGATIGAIPGMVIIDVVGVMAHSKVYNALWLLAVSMLGISILTERKESEISLFEGTLGPGVWILGVFASVAVSVLAMIVLGRVQNKNSRNRQHTVSRCTAQLVWIDRPSLLLPW